jgi:hypothetical protein
LEADIRVEHQNSGSGRSSCEIRNSAWKVRFGMYCGRWLRFGELRQPAMTCRWRFLSIPDAHQVQ